MKQQPNGKARPQEEAYLHHVVPCRQKQAQEFLAGRSPGVMQRYAPNAHASTEQGWVEDEDTVHRLAHWRQEAIY